MQVKNISGDDLNVPSLGRMVEAGRVIDVTEEQVIACVIGTTATWEAHDKAAKEAVSKYLKAVASAEEDARFGEPVAAPVEDGES